MIRSPKNSTKVVDSERPQAPQNTGMPVTPVELLMSSATQNLPEVLTLQEVSNVLRCSKAHVCKAVNGDLKGIRPIPTVSMGRRKLVLRSSLLRWITENERTVSATISSSSEIDAG